jgi:hypothetical protein
MRFDFEVCGLILLAIRQGILTVEQADEIKTLLEANRFRMGFGVLSGLGERM